MTRDPGPTTARGGCLVLVVGVAAGYGIHRLSAEARSTCRLLLREHPGFFDLWTWEPVLTMAAAVVLSLAAWGLAVFATRRTGHRARRAAPALAVLVTLAVLALAHFALIGTPAEAARDIPLCPVGNVPPWWPSWLPH